MSINHGTVAGIGITLTDDMKEIIMNGDLRFPTEDWEDDFHWCLEKIGLKCGESGCFLSGTNIKIHLFIEGDTLDDINNNAPAFIKKLAEYGIIIKGEDLMVIREMRMG